MTTTLSGVSEASLGEATQACDLSDVAVIIPAYNEEASLPLVLRDLPDVGCVIVVDNASCDSTAAVARAHGAHVVREDRRGYGSACLAGIAAAYSWFDDRAAKPGIIVFLDGDYSDHPDQLTRLVEPILKDRCDFVLGTRIGGEREPGAMPPQSVYGNKLACFLMRLFWGVSYTDLGPFRAIRVDALRGLGMEDRNFGWTVEMQIKSVQAGLRTKEVPVAYRRRIGISKISGTVSGTIKAGYKILYTIGKYRWKSWLRKPLQNNTTR